MREVLACPASDPFPQKHLPICHAQEGPSVPCYDTSDQLWKSRPCLFARKKKHPLQPPQSSPDSTTSTSSTYLLRYFAPSCHLSICLRTLVLGNSVSSCVDSRRSFNMRVLWLFSSQATWQGFIRSGDADAKHPPSHAWSSSRVRAPYQLPFR